MGILLSILEVMGVSCMDNFLPEEKDAFDRDVNFTTTQWDTLHFIRVYLVRLNQLCP